MKGLNKVFLFLVIITIPLCLNSQTYTNLKEILKRGELRIGTSGNQPPYSMKDKDGNFMGYETDLAKLIAEATNLKLKFVQKPFAELLPALEKGEVDIIMSGMTITPERNLKATFLGPYIISGKSILAKAKRIALLDEMNELNQEKVKVVVLEGSTSESFVKKQAPKIKLSTTKDYTAAVKMVLEDKVDVMVADYPICLISILRHPEAGLGTLDAPLTIEPIGLALPPNAFQLHNMIENFLSALQMTGKMEELRIEWFENSAWLIRLP